MSRIEETLRIALRSLDDDEKVLLDCYNKKVANRGVSYTITTRISASNHYWVFEIDD